MCRDIPPEASQLTQSLGEAPLRRLELSQDLIPRSSLILSLRQELEAPLLLLTGAGKQTELHSLHLLGPGMPLWKHLSRPRPSLEPRAVRLCYVHSANPCCGPGLLLSPEIHQRTEETKPLLAGSIF